MNILRHFRNGLLSGTAMSAEGSADAGGGGNAPANSDFIASLPEPLRGNEAFKDVKDAGDLAARYVDARTFKVPEKFTKENPALNDIKNVDGLVERMLNAEKMVGADKARVALIPKDDADADGWNKFYAAQGRPEAADKYQLPAKRADGKDYSDADKAFQQGILPLLHEAGLTQRQLSLIAPKWDALQASAGAAYDAGLVAEQKKASDALRAELGAEYDPSMKLAEDAIKHYSGVLKLGPELGKELNASAIGNSPALAKLLIHIGGQLKEDGVIGKGGGQFSELTADAAKTQIKEKEKVFRENAVFQSDKKAPGRAEALAEIAELYQVAYPQENAAA